MPSTTAIAAFLEAEFPQTKCTVDAVGDFGATVRHPVSVAELRPGGTVSLALSGLTEAPAPGLAQPAEAAADRE